jgi:hypothetical protein
MGETDFIASNRTRAGREQNRRVEIEFIYTARQYPPAVSAIVRVPSPD